MSLKSIPVDRFHVEDGGIWSETQVIVDAWGLPSRALAELDLNRKGAIVPNPRKHAAFAGRSEVIERYHAGFKWEDDDSATARWIPQGLTGDADSRDNSDGARWLAVSWHNEHDAVEKGMRLSFVDVTSWCDPIRYRHVLLVEPIEDASGHASFRAIPAHAGGALWFRDYLYVADSRGFDAGKPGGVLVFDITRLKELDSSRDDAVASPTRRRATISGASPSGPAPARSLP